MTACSSKIKDQILVLEPVPEELPRHWHKLLADRVYLSNESWLLGKVSSAPLVFHAVSLPMKRSGFDVSDIDAVIHRQRIVYDEFFFPPPAFTYSFVGRGELVQDARYNLALLELK